MSSLGVVLFHTSSAAMRAEALLGRVGLMVKLIPTPRELSSDCGVALRFDWDERVRVEAILEEQHVETSDVSVLPEEKRVIA